MSMKRQYHYTKIDGLYVRLDQNLVLLSWYLLTRTRPFHFHQPAANRYLKVFPRKMIKVLRVAHFTQRLVWKKYFQKRKDNELLKAKFDGHLLLKTSNGYKIFDLKENHVITKYKEFIKSEVFDSILENLNRMKEFGIAPKLLFVEPNDKYYIEEYINLYKAEIYFPITSYFYKKILPIWEKSINQFQQTEVEIAEYVNEQKTFIFEKTTELMNKNHNENIINELRSFVEKTADEIMNEYKGKSMYLSISHGDLHAWNILLSKKEAKLIDWDTMKERSLLHDLFYMFIHSLYGRANINYAPFTLEMERCTKKVWARLVAKKSFLLDLEIDVYRRIFYLEYIYLDLENRINVENNRELLIRHLRKMNEWIKIFEKLERNREFPTLLKGKERELPLKSS